MFDKFKKFKKRHKVLFAVAVGFSVVAFWRGAWGLMDVYLFPGNYALSSWASFIIGLGILYATHYIIEAVL